MSDKRDCCRVFLESFGCSSNIADGEFMAGLLSKAGFRLVETEEEADVLVYNTCAVKTPTENRMIEVLRRAGAKKDKKLVVTGCLPLVNFERLETEVDFDGALGPTGFNKIAEAVAKVNRDEKVLWLDGKSESRPSIDLPRRAVNQVVSIVPIASGCAGSCSYCCVRFARGNLHSLSLNEIINRIESDLASGAQEVWLTGQDAGCYGKDIGVNLVDLLSAVCEIDGDFWIRVGMMTPNSALGMLPELVKVFTNDRIFKFVHLPVQSGDDEILKQMNRHYSVEDFLRVVKAFRKSVPDITLSTDVICGFPGESAEAFERTLQLIKQVRPDVVNVSKFFPRPRTSAAEMTPKVPSLEVMARSKRLTNFVRKTSFEKNSSWVGWNGRVLLDEVGKKPDSLIGRNFAYKPIVVKNVERSLLGSFLDARVTRAFQTYLEAEIIS